MSPKSFARKIIAVLLGVTLLNPFLLSIVSSAATPNFGYLGYSWVSSESMLFEFSPPEVSETVREYQLGAKYSLSSCQANTVPVCSYSDVEIIKNILPGSTGLIGNRTFNSSNGTSRSFKGVRSFSLLAEDLQRYLAAKTSSKERSIVLYLRAVYGTTTTEWSDGNFVEPSKIWQSNQNSQSSVAISNITIGFQGPLSGPEELIGKSQLSAVKFAVTKFNEAYAGKIKVNVAEADDMGDPAIARDVAAKLVSNSSVIGVVGPSYSGASLVSFPSYKAANLAMISPSAIRDTLTDPTVQGAQSGIPVFHRIPATDKSQGPSLYRLAIDGVSTPKVFIIDDSNSGAQSLFSYMKASFMPGHYVGNASVPYGSNDFSSAIAKMKSSGANVVIYLGYYSESAKLIKQLRDSSYTGIIATNDGSFDTQLFKLLSNSASEGLRVTSNTAPIKDISSALALDFEKTVGSTAGIYAAESIDAANVLLYCISQNAKSRNEMLSCVKSFRGESVYGDQFGFDSNGDNTAARFVSFVVRNGEFKTLNALNPPRGGNSKWWPWYPFGQGTNTEPEPEPTSKPKPQKPTFSGVNFVGNKININVSFGGANNAPDKVYLVAPKLGINADKPAPGNISGGTASWSLDFDKLLSGTAIPLEVVAEKDGVKSDPNTGNFLAPDLIEKKTSPPAQPSDFKSRIVGNSAVLTVESTMEDALYADGYLFGKSLGLAKSQAIQGELVGTQFVFEVPLKSSMAGKKFPLTIYLQNSQGESKPLNATLKVPAAPKKVVPKVTPKPGKSETVICSRSSQTRTFAGTKCPPGWTEK